MLTAGRAFWGSSDDGVLLPPVAGLQPLYDWGVQPREGQLIMVAGRSGSQKSGFVLYWVAHMGVPTLYLSGDMAPWEASERLACTLTGWTSEQVRSVVEAGDPDGVVSGALAGCDITFSFRQPIMWQSVDEHLEAFVETRNMFPKVIVVDNLMDVDGCEGEYKEQQTAMQSLAALSRDTGCTVIVIHHATDKAPGVDQLPGLPPARSHIKNGLSEKPQLVLTVALSTELGYELRVACVKQRSGKSDPAAQEYIRLLADPERTRYLEGPPSFYPWR